MKNYVTQDNKSRWALFEQVSPTGNAVLWAVIAVAVAVGAYYVIA